MYHEENNGSKQVIYGLTHECAPRKKDVQHVR